MRGSAGWAKRAVPIATLRLRLLGDRHRNAGNFEVDRTERRAARKKQRLPIVAAEPEIGGCRLTVNDAAELLALGVEDVEPARTAAVDVAGDIDLHAVGHARLGAAQIGKHAVGLP